MPANLKQLLLARSDWFAREIMSGVRRSEYAYITPAQSRLLAHMGGKPMNMAELARRGILEIRDDPERRNAKLIVYTERGRQVNRVGAAIIDRLEDRIASRIGRDRLETLKSLLAEDWG